MDAQGRIAALQAEVRRLRAARSLLLRLLEESLQAQEELRRRLGRRRAVER